VRQADHDRFQHKLYFFYANHRPEDAPFLDLLKDLERTNPNLRFIGAMTNIVAVEDIVGWRNRPDRQRDAVDIS
jgi:hypothetical protein